MSALIALLLLVLRPPSEAPPRVLETVDADYPAWAGGTGLSTRVALRVRVGADGSVRRVDVIPYSVRRDLLSRRLRASFDSAAVQAVRRWRFDPATRAGRPVEAWLRVEVPFEPPWGRLEGPFAVMPDSFRSSTLWTALVGEWWRVPIRGVPVGRAGALLFRRDGRFMELDAAGGEREGRFEVSSDGTPGDTGARLVRIPGWAGGARRVDRVRFAGRDTLILCPLRSAGSCDSFVGTARGGGR